MLERLTDAADCFGEAEHEELNDLLNTFEERFPQLFLAIYVGYLPEMTDNRQFAFWLLNRATVPSMDHTRPNENGSLLVLDLSSRTISFTLGYFVEPYFDDHALSTILKKGHADLSSEDYFAAFQKIVPAFSRQLVQRAKVRVKQPEEPVQTQVSSGLLERMRGEEGYQEPLSEPQSMSSTN